MKNVTKKIIKCRYKFTVSIFAAIVACFAFSLFFAANGAARAEGIFGGAEFEESYRLGYELTVPQSVFLVGQQVIPAQAVIVFPSGKAYLKEKAVLSEAGVYTVNYTCTSGGRYYKAFRKFSVNRDLYTFSAENSSAEYGTYDNVNKNGLKVRLAEGETIEFQAVIDLNDVSREDTLIEFFAAPENIDKIEFKKIVITLTDVTDQNSFVKILCQGTSEEWAYNLVGGNGQNMVGLEQHASGDRLHVDNQFGTSLMYRFYGNYKNGDKLGSRTVRYSYDAQDKAFYLNNTIIADLDDPYYYYNLWQGFKSGLVRVSISCGDYLSSHANFVIMTLAGTKLTAQTAEDTEGPEITVNTLGYVSAPAAKTGYPYAIFPASAYDKYDGDIEVKVNVYKNYDKIPINVSVTGGMFTPSEEREYVIEYSACDYSGNVSKEIIRVTSLNSIVEPIINIESNRITSAAIGENVKVADFGIGGGTGNIAVDIKAVSPSESIKVEGDSFTPMYAETYNVIYSVTDYIGQAAFRSYKVDVAQGDKPVFNTVPNLLPYYISGNDYTMPEYYAVDYANGGLKVLSLVSVSDASGTRAVPAGGMFRPEVVNNFDKVLFTFTAGGASVTYTVPVVLASVGGNVKMGNYFCCDGVEAIPASGSIDITALSGDGGWTFAKRLPSESFSVKLNQKKGSAAYKGLKLTLTDSLDKNISAGILFLKEGTRTKIICGSNVFMQDFDLGGENGLAVSYSGKTFKIGAFPIDVSSNIHGGAFGGFPSGLVYLSIKFIEAEENASYSITDICLQAMSDRSSDNQRAHITIFGDSYGGSFGINAKAIIPAALACDVLSEDVAFTLTVTDSDEIAVMSTDGIMLRNVSPGRSYEITLGKYGTYIASYRAIDSGSGRAIIRSFTIIVVDYEKPVITLSGNYHTSAKVGDTINIAEMTAADNLTPSEDIKCYRYIITPAGKAIMLSENTKTYKTESVGKYIVRYVGFDGMGNMQMTQYYVTVTP